MGWREYEHGNLFDYRFGEHPQGEWVAYDDIAPLLAEREELLAETREAEEWFRHIMSESCDASEVHCPCVPLLRKRVKEWRALLQRIASWATVDATFECFPAHMKEGLELIAKEAKEALQGVK
jgi:hypothetical protein